VEEIVEGYVMEMIWWCWNGFLWRCHRSTRFRFELHVEEDEVQSENMEQSTTPGVFIEVQSLRNNFQSLIWTNFVDDYENYTMEEMRKKWLLLC